VGEDVRNLTSEPPNGLHCQILVMEERKVAVGLWPVESVNVSRQWRAAFGYKTFDIKPIEKTGRPNTWLITAKEGRLFTVFPQLSW
jgi:hypothetical protein